MRVGKLEVEVRLGDLTQQEADAIVNPANSQLWMGGGAAGALKRAGGEQIEREARKHAPLEVGRAVATTAGRLKARWVVHAPTMERPAMATTAEKVYKATLAALRCANELGAESIVIPGMGTGVGGVPADQAAAAMVRAIREFEPTASSLTRVVLCDLSEPMVRAWREALVRK